MTKKELKIWFWNIFCSCYMVEHKEEPYHIFMIYDKNFIRKTKFKILQGDEPEKPNDINGVIMFEFYFDSLFYYNYHYIHKYLELNTTNDIPKMIVKWLTHKDSKEKLKMFNKYYDNMEVVYDKLRAMYFLPTTSIDLQKHKMKILW